MRFEKQQIAIVLFFIALIAVFAALQYRPMRDQARAFEQLKSAQLAATGKTHQQIRNLPELRAELRQLRSNLENVNKRIPDEPRLGAFLKEIADAMNKYRLTEQVVQPETEVRIDNNFLCIPVKMQCRGTLRQVFDFFTSLQNLDRLIKIEQLQLKNDQDLTGSLTMIAVGNIYYRTDGFKQAGAAL